MSVVSVEIIQGPDKGGTFQIDTEGIVGRQSETVRLTDSTVSRRHARLLCRDEVWTIEDTGSANGTFLNGIRVNKPTPLHLGDQIRCGTTLLVFGGVAGRAAPRIDVDETGMVLDAAIMATVPASDDSVIIPTPEAGAEAISNLRILYDLSTELSSIFEMDTLLRHTLDVVFKVVRADHAFILLTDDGGRLVPKAARYREQPPANSTDGSQPELLLKPPLPISRTIIDEVISKQVGVLSSNAMRDKRFGSGKSVHEYGIRSAICVPIKGREGIIGVIHVDCSVSDHTYSTEQLRLLTAIGYQAGLAVENARLHEAAMKSERLAAVGETVALLSHHTKNILQALTGAAELVAKALAADDAARANEIWPVVSRSLERLNAVILNMLAFSKPRQLLLESVNVNHVIEECVDLLTARADERSVALMTDLTDLPPIPADPAGLHQVILNLLTNAIDAVAGETGVITVSSKFDSMNRQVIVSVADNGVGIAPDQIDRIFDVFHSTKGQKGTGLGLTVAKKVVSEHGGRIEVKSAPGEGTTFTTFLPAQVGPAPSSSETRAG